MAGMCKISDGARQAARENMKMTPPLDIGDIRIHWLGGGDFRLDGGTMFGPVPKVLWQKRYPVDALNTIHMCNDPLLVKTPDTIILVDSGLGNKLSEKQNSIFQVSPPWDLPRQLGLLGLSREDVGLVILTHCDFDHAGGIEMINADGGRELTFPRATHLIQETEWQDVQQPCDRAKATYLEENFILLRRQGRLQLIDGDLEVCPGVRVRHTGGHTSGHQLVEMSSRGETAVHLGDLCPTHAHINPLWVMAYDDFPLTVIERKKQFLQEYSRKNSWFTMYHDPFFRAVKFDAAGGMVSSWPVSAGNRGENGPAAQQADRH
jgi:glyoxylase-like metal-dependent hydrolase (beta-lactamase superfamily II)